MHGTPSQQNTTPKPEGVRGAGASGGPGETFAQSHRGQAPVLIRALGTSGDGQDDDSAHICERPGCAAV